MTNHQRKGSLSNADVGRKFEEEAKRYFYTHESMALTSNYAIDIGVATVCKQRRFDLGSDRPPVLIECKSHRWTETGNMPSAKVTVWNESMYYFHIAPNRFRKILFVLKDVHEKRQVSLAQYYCRNYAHLIPPGVEIVEYDELSRIGVLVHKG
jgi:hypothetical protein